MQLRVEVAAEKNEERQLLRYLSESIPEIGARIEVGGTGLIVTNVLESIDPTSSDVLIEARRLRAGES
jgi:hypothetical protein